MPGARSDLCGPCSQGLNGGCGLSVASAPSLAVVANVSLPLSHHLTLPSPLRASSLSAALRYKDYAEADSDTMSASW